jgi:hexosaminidase
VARLGRTPLVVGGAGLCIAVGIAGCTTARVSTPAAPDPSASAPATVPPTVLASVPATTPATAPATVPATAPATVPATVPATAPATAAASMPAVGDADPSGGLVPLPVSLVPEPSSSFVIGSHAAIAVSGTGAQQVGLDLADMLRPATGFALPVVTGTGSAGDITLALAANDPTLGAQGYTLAVSPTGVTIEANQPAGLFDGIQTLRQLLPSQLEASSLQAGPWVVPGARISDYPRYAYRGAMLDVARHFFPVATVERYIDELAMYKINVLHLHLSDDQGWRLAVDGWPALTTVGSRTAVGGGSGGFYTESDYTAIVKYAQARFITVVPEIDMPGHVGAALSSYASLNCDGVAPPINTTENVGHSSMCVGKPAVAQFLTAVIGELAKLTPGPYIDIGGDEAASTSVADYASFMSKAAQLVKADGKTPMGWADFATAQLPVGAVAQYWDYRTGAPLARQAVSQGAELVMSPADHTYLDQKYTPATTLGLQWAGTHEVEDAYNWDPATVVPGFAADVIGVEAPLWTETLISLQDLQYMAFPRIAELAEVGWTPQAQRNWSTFAPRLAAQGAAWKLLGINYYASPLVAWPANALG